MKRPKLVIASILKPVDDTRMYEKFGKSLGQTNKYEINIIGFWTKKKSDFSNIIFHPIFNFKRLSWKRLFLSFTYLIALVKIRPKIIIITTHELLLPSLFYKLTHRVKIIYDIRENYYANIKYLNAYSPFIKHLLANWVRLKEMMTSSFISHFTLAEICYKKELTFTRGKCTVIENKATRILTDLTKIQNAKHQNLTVVFTGTISESTGIFQCIKTVKALHALDSKVQLKIVGYCANEHTLKEVLLEVENEPYIQLIGGNKLVSHDVILKEISLADFGFIYYPPNKANDNCIPTKVYEYVACSLPYLTSINNSYTLITSQFKCGILLDFSKPNYLDVLAQIEQLQPFQNANKAGVFWEEEEDKLINLLNYN